MMRQLLLIMMLGLVMFTAHAQRPDNYPPDNTDVILSSTNLPIVWVDVKGQTIDREERITAHMKVIHNGDGNLNYADTVAHPGQRIDYEGYIAIRYRGNSSFTNSDKKPYSFRPLDKPLEDGGTKKKVDILGMGKDNNWALLAPYSDKSMIRDMLAFEISRPWMEYTPEGRHCELFLDGIYYGVYILTEVVSKGKTRLNLDDPGNSGDDITGGYLLEVDREDEEHFISKHSPKTSTGEDITSKYIHFQYGSPDYEDMTEKQIMYIQKHINEMEDMLASSNYRDTDNGYSKYLDVTSCIDYQIAMELGHNVDAYRLSGKLFKRRDSEDPRFKMVVWDMNLAYGNADYYQAAKTDTWMYQHNDVLIGANDPYMVPFWWYRLNNDPQYTEQLKMRWSQYRRTNLRQDNLMATIDSLTTVLTSHGAEERNSKAWPRWGQYVWPNYIVMPNYGNEIAFLKYWLQTRIKWMDGQLGFDPSFILRGDANCDNIINISDITSLIDYLIGGDHHGLFDTLAADVNNDGRITISDITELIDYLTKR